MARKIILLTALLTAMLLGTSCAGLTAAKDVVVSKALKAKEKYCEGSELTRMIARKELNSDVLKGELAPIVLAHCPQNLAVWKEERKKYILPLASSKVSVEDAILADFIRKGFQVTHDSGAVPQLIDAAFIADLESRGYTITPPADDEEVPDEDEP